MGNGPAHCQILSSPTTSIAVRGRLSSRTQSVGVALTLHCGRPVRRHRAGLVPVLRGRHSAGLSQCDWRAAERPALCTRRKSDFHLVRRLSSCQRRRQHVGSIGPLCHVILGTQTPSGSRFGCQRSELGDVICVMRRVPLCRIPPDSRGDRDHLQMHKCAESFARKLYNFTHATASAQQFGVYLRGQVGTDSVRLFMYVARFAWTSCATPVVHN